MSEVWRGILTLAGLLDLRSHVASTQLNPRNSSLMPQPLLPTVIICAAKFKIRAAAWVEVTPRAWMLEIRFRSESE